MRNAARTLAFAGVFVVATAAVASCSDDSGSSSEDSQPEYTTTTTPEQGDGVLRIGLLLPQSGDGSQLGDPLIDVAMAAVEAVNDAGGVLGRDVELVVSDEGADSATALTSVDEMIGSRSIDAVIGPLSSTVALGVVPHRNLLTGGHLGISRRTPR
jgi:branched-chain amino acid transport system substrate-binding protein